MKKEKQHKKLQYLTDAELLQAYELQRKNRTWDFLKERELWENKFGTSFNNFLIVYSIFLNVIIQTKPLLVRLGVLTIGIIVSILMLSILHRTYVKLDIILKIVYSLPNQTISYISKEQKAYKSFEVTTIMGKHVPTLCVITLILGFFYTGYQYILSQKKPQEQKIQTEKVLNITVPTNQEKPK